MKRHRQTITFSLPQIEYLKREADVLGVGVSETIRHIINAHKRETEKRTVPERSDCR